MYFSRFGMCRNAGKLLVAATLISFLSLSHAEDSTLSEQVYLQDFPVVLSASRLSQPLSEAPNAMTVIDRGMIKSSGFRTIADLFRLVPGMYVGDVSGHKPVVGYHGSTEEFSRRMQVLIDGRSVYLPPFSTVDWEDIPLHIDDIERIEVVRGPAAASYGANSLQGVINIITRDASSVNGVTTSFTSGFEGVSDVAAHMGQSGEKLDYRLTLAHREDSGYGDSVMNDGKSTNQANFRANFHPIGANSFDFQLGYSDSTRGQGIIGKGIDDLFRNVRITSSFQQATWLHALQGGDEFKLSYYHINRNYVDDQYSPPYLAYTLPSQTVSDRHDLELQQTSQLGRSNRLVWGAGVRTDYADSREHLVVPYTIQQSRVFAHDEWRIIPSTLLNVGAMIENDGLGHTNTSPRLALNYHVLPQHTLRASTSVAYRTPAIYEEKANIPSGYVSLGGLRPERTLSREIGYLGEFRNAGITLDVRAYDDKVSDIIFIDPAATETFTPYGFGNMYAANYYGYEGTMKYRWNDSGNITINFARQFARCEATAIPTNATVLLPYGVDLVAIMQGYMDECAQAVPDYSGSILLTQQLSRDLQFSAGYYHQARIKMIANVPQSVMNRLDLRLAQVFGKRGQPGSGELALVLQNAFEDDYTKYSTTEYTDNMQFKRRAYINASFNF